MTDAITTTQQQQREAARALGGADVLTEAIERRKMIMDALRQGVMTKGVHYGQVPGCGSRYVLLQPGAQALGVLMRLRPEYDIRTVDRPGGHTEYIIVTRLIHYPTGTWVATGVGSAATDESRYLTRWVPAGQPIPKDYQAKKAEYNRQGYAARQIDGQWTWCRKSEEAVVDQRNTVLKMAKKRAYVDAIIQAAAASDLFTQDLEDDVEDIAAGQESAKAPQMLPGATESLPAPTAVASQNAEAFAQLVAGREADVNAYLVSLGRIKEGQTWRDADEAVLARAIASRQRFMAQVDRFAQGGERHE